MRKQKASIFIIYWLKGSHIFYYMHFQVRTRHRQWLTPLAGFYLMILILTIILIGQKLAIISDRCHDVWRRVNIAKYQIANAIQCRAFTEAFRFRTFFYICRQGNARGMVDNLRRTHEPISGRLPATPLMSRLLNSAPWLSVPFPLLYGLSLPSLILNY